MEFHNFLQLPEEMLYHIVSFADVDELKNLSRASHFMFHITAKFISNQCVINPGRMEEEKQLCDLKALRRKYFNVKLNSDCDDAIIKDVPNVIPKTVFVDYWQHNATAIAKFVNDNSVVEKVFLSIYGSCFKFLPDLPRKVSCCVYKISPDDYNELVLWTQQFTHLSEIIIADVWNNHDKLKTLPSYNLRRLSLCYIRAWSDIPELLLEKFVNLRCLRLNCSYVEKLNLTSLKSLSLNEMTISKEFLTSISRNSSLTTLKIQESYFKKDCSSSDFAFMKNIRMLSIEDKMLEKVADHLENVESLEFYGSKCLSAPKLFLPKLKNIFTSEYGDDLHETFLKSISAPNLEFLSLLRPLNWVPRCQRLQIKDVLEVTEIHSLMNDLESKAFVVPKIFMKCLKMESSTLGAILRMNVKNMAFIIDVEEQYPTDLLEMTNNFEGITIEEKNERSFTIFKC